MSCPKCKKELPEGARYCMFCGSPLNAPERRQKPKRRGNGQGTAYRRGSSWAALWRHYYGENCVRIYKGGFPTKTAALEWLAHVREAPREDPDITFEKLYEKWIERHKERVTRATVQCYQAAYKYFEDVRYLPFALLTTEALQDCVDECPRGTRTRENMKALCTCLYKYAHEIGVAAENYGQHIYIKREASTEKRAFSNDELERLFAAAPVVPNIDVVLILCYTGFRLNELLAMERSAFDPQMLTLRGGSKTAAGKDRVVPVSPKILPFVMARFEQNGPRLISEDGRRITTNHWRELQARALAAVDGVRGLSPHECRHTFASLMKRVQAPSVDKKRLIGHTSDAMLEHYTHTQIEELRAITNAL